MNFDHYNLVHVAEDVGLGLLTVINLLTSYWPFIPCIVFCMDIPGAKHFLLRILTVIGVVTSRVRRSLQQLNAITSL